MDAIQKTGKTVDEAVALALGELGITKDEAEIEVIEEGSRGFLGMFGAKDAVVKVKKKFDMYKAKMESLLISQILHSTLSVVKLLHC